MIRLTELRKREINLRQGKKGGKRFRVINSGRSQRWSKWFIHQVNHFPIATGRIVSARGCGKKTAFFRWKIVPIHSCRYFRNHFLNGLLRKMSIRGWKWRVTLNRIESFLDLREATGVRNDKNDFYSWHVCGFCRESLLVIHVSSDTEKLQCLRVPTRRPPASFPSIIFLASGKR